MKSCSISHAATTTYFITRAQSFAESFFARGVANFACTAWLVDDTAAREFAVHLYSRLLGLERKNGQYVKGNPEAMHRAMRLARIAIANQDYGLQTWEAYQHYGNPRLRFFDMTTLTGTVNQLPNGKPGESTAKSPRRRLTSTQSTTRTRSLEERLPWLYLKGLSTSDFSSALTALLGQDAAGLSAKTGRLALLMEAASGRGLAALDSSVRYTIWRCHTAAEKERKSERKDRTQQSDSC